MGVEYVGSEQTTFYPLTIVLIIATVDATMKNLKVHNWLFIKDCFQSSKEHFCIIIKTFKI